MSATYSIVVKWKRFIQSVIKRDTPMNYDKINGKLRFQITQISILLKTIYICFIHTLGEN